MSEDMNHPSKPLFSVHLKPSARYKATGSARGDFGNDSAEPSFKKRSR